MLTESDRPGGRYFECDNCAIRQLTTDKLPVVANLPENWFAKMEMGDVLHFCCLDCLSSWERGD